MMQKMKIIKKNIGVQTPGNIFPKGSWQEKKSKKKKKPFKEGGTNRTDAHPDPAPTVKGRRLLYQNNHKGSTDWSRLMRGKFLRPPWLWLLFATKCTCCSSCSYGLSTWQALESPGRQALHVPERKIPDCANRGEKVTLTMGNTSPWAAGLSTSIHRSPSWEQRQWDQLPQSPAAMTSLPWRTLPLSLSPK